MKRQQRHETQICVGMEWQAQQGMTLIELMVGIVITLLVVAAGFVVLTTTEKSTRANEQTVDTQQNARIAMELLARDIKMAGFGMAGMLSGAAATTIGTCGIGGSPVPVVPVDQTPAGADTGPDQIRLLVPLGSSANPTWTVANSPTVGGSNGFSQITLPSGAVTAMQTNGLAVGSVISIGGAVATKVTNADPSSNTISFTETDAIPGPATFATGTPVYLLQCVTYDVGTTSAACSGGTAPCLRRNGAVIAEGIEDLQFEYACDGCVGAVNSGIADGIVDDQAGGTAGSFDAADFVTNSAWATTPMTSDKIRLVKIFIVARQMLADQGLGEVNQAGVLTAGPLQVSDHNHANGVFASGDYGTLNPPYTQYRRRVLTRTVETRNLGL